MPDNSPAKIILSEQCVSHNSAQQSNFKNVDETMDE